MVNGELFSLTYDIKKFLIKNVIFYLIKFGFFHYYLRPLYAYFYLTNPQKY